MKRIAVFTTVLVACPAASAPLPGVNDEGIYPELAPQVSLVAYGWRVDAGRVVARGHDGFGDLDRDHIPDPVDILLGAKKVALDRSPYRETAPRLRYPGGDVPRGEGVCTDVVIRALRNAGLDLQRAIYEDAGAAPEAYPRIGGKRNASIDHRRVKNLIHYFDRHWRRIPAGAPLAPGDVLFLDVVAKVADPDHIGIASDRRNSLGLPLVIHNWSEAGEMDILPGVPLIAAFRVPPRRPAGINSGGGDAARAVRIEAGAAALARGDDGARARGDGRGPAR